MYRNFVIKVTELHIPYFRGPGVEKADFRCSTGGSLGSDLQGRWPDLGSIFQDSFQDYGGVP